MTKSFLQWRDIDLIPVGKPTGAPVIVAFKNGSVLTGLIAQEDDKTILLQTSWDTRLLAKKDIAERATAKGVPAPAITKVDPALTWQSARETDAALVRVSVAGEKPEWQLEKFLFYRGLGTFALPLQVRSQQQGGDLRLNLQNPTAQPLSGLCAVEVQGGTIRFALLGSLAGHGHAEVPVAKTFSAPQPLAEGVPAAKQAVASALTAAGLYPKEAQAMVNTWERSYFRTEGLRLLYILPRPNVDRLIPIDIKPAPQELVRIMVGRVEVLTPQREQQIEQYVAALAADDFKAREKATVGLAQLGRIGEPALRRVLTKTTDPEVRRRAQMLIARMGK